MSYSSFLWVCSVLTSVFLFASFFLLCTYGEVAPGLGCRRRRTLWRLAAFKEKRVSNLLYIIQVLRFWCWSKIRLILHMLNQTHSAVLRGTTDDRFRPLFSPRFSVDMVLTGGLCGGRLTDLKLHHPMKVTMFTIKIRLIPTLKLQQFPSLLSLPRIRCFSLAVNIAN